MATEQALFAIWLTGMFGIIGGVVYWTARAVLSDSRSYDEQFVWGRKLDEPYE